MKKNIINLILVILWMIFIFTMSSFSATKSSEQSGLFVNIFTNIFNLKNLSILEFLIRKCAHFTEYLILGLLVYNLIKNYNKSIILAIFICILYAVSDEVHQLFVVGRACRVFDVFVDTIGSIAGIYIYKLFLKIKNKI